MFGSQWICQILSTDKAVACYEVVKLWQPQSYAHTRKLGGLENTELFYITLLRPLRVNFLQWLIKYINIHGGSRIIAENNEIHLMKNQNLLIHALQLNIFWSTHYNSKLHNNSTREYRATMAEENLHYSGPVCSFDLKISTIVALFPLITLLMTPP